jgi:hypothetical protein
MTERHSFNGTLDYRFRSYDDSNRRNDSDLRWNLNVSRPVDDDNLRFGVRGRASYRGDGQYRNDWGVFADYRIGLGENDQLTIGGEVRERRYPSGPLRSRTRDIAELMGSWTHSLANGRSYGIGRLELPSVAELRARALEEVRTRALVDGKSLEGVLSVSNVSGDVRALHADRAHQGALFQVASQFNMLEMIGPEVTPEEGVTRYASDHTQGPACAVAAGGNEAERVLPQVEQTIRKSLLLASGDTKVSKITSVVNKINKTWASLISLTVQTPKQVSAALNSDPLAMEIVCELIKELHINSFKHGRASECVMTLSLSDPGVLHLQMQNNGAPVSAQKSSGEGLGENFITTVTLSYSAQNIPEGVQIDLEIPLEGSPEVTAHQGSSASRV